MVGVIVMLTCSLVFARTIHVAVVDTGISLKDARRLKLCRDVESKDFTGTTLEDNHGHGRNVTNIIRDTLKGLDYCLVIVKVINVNHVIDIESYFEALKYIAQQPSIEVVNFSIEGTIVYSQEIQWVKTMLDNGKVVIAAAGNGKKELQYKCEIYPACIDDRIVVVGCLKIDGKMCDLSNFGSRVDVWRLGDNVSAGGISMTGTSQATARETGLFVRGMLGRTH